MPRPRSNRIRPLGEHEIRGRVALDNARRSQSSEPHDRRKPTVGGTGNPELADGAVDGRALRDNLPGEKLRDNSIGSDKIAGLGWSKLNGVPDLAGRPYVDNTAEDIRAWVRKNFRQVRR